MLSDQTLFYSNQNTSMNTSNLAYATMNPMSLLNDESVVLDNDQNSEDVSDSSSSSSSENEDETLNLTQNLRPYIKPFNFIYEYMSHNNFYIDPWSTS